MREVPPEHAAVLRTARLMVDARGTYSPMSAAPVPDGAKRVVVGDGDSIPVDTAGVAFVTRCAPRAALAVSP